MQTLTRLDAYVLARALAGVEWTGLRVSPAIELILTNLGGQADRGLLTKILGTEAISQVFAVDPHGPAPDGKVEAELIIPPLPEEAHVPKRIPTGIGTWLDEFLEWATRRSPMTPPRFLEAAGIWALGLAIARRCALKLHAPIYPHLYILWVAPTSVFKKTTGMEAVADLINQAMPHMLLPEDSTPEAFVSALSGKQPSNYESLSAYEKRIDNEGRLYAAQRGILLDEASSLIGAAKRDYMAGFTEMLLRLYDGPARYTRNIRSEGKIVIRDASLSILGATTPAAIVRNTNGESWETGEMARYALLYPECDMAYDLGQATPEEFVPPAGLVKRLRRLHQALPKPPDATFASADEGPASLPVLSCLISQEAYAAYAAYTKAVTYDMLKGDSLDTRLRPNYARLHIQAIKIALSLAAIEWADRNCLHAPRIELAHWARAQKIAETWRTSLHKLLHELDKCEDAIVENRILEHLVRYPSGETLRELTQRLRINRKVILESLHALAESGLVEITTRQGSRGPATTIYKAV